jgi:hypothetical protein
MTEARDSAEQLATALIAVRDRAVDLLPRGFEGFSPETIRTVRCVVADANTVVNLWLVQPTDQEILEAYWRIARHAENVTFQPVFPIWQLVIS